MTEAGFFAQKRSSPSSLAMVVMLHAGLIAAVVMIKSPQFIRDHVPLVVTAIPIDPDPPVDPPPPQQQHPRQPVPTIDHFPPIVDSHPDTGPVVAINDHPVVIADNSGAGTGYVPPPTIAPIRHAADFDPRYASALQPPYPSIEERAQRDGVVRVRVTIGPDGRVKAVERLQATSDAFWRVTQQQALNHWRFRPATLDGRPVEDSKVVTLNFRIADL